MNKKYIRILAEMAIVLSAVGMMTGCVNKNNTNNDNVDFVQIDVDIVATDDEMTTHETIADSSSYIESSESSKIESSSKIDSSSNANSSDIESSSLNENSLNESSKSDSSSEICNSENVQNNVEVPSDNVTYEVWDNEKSVGEPVQGKTYEPVEENKKSVGDAVVGYTEADVELLASLINHESSFTDEGRLMVGSVVVNRMNNTGDSLYDTIAAPGQFVSPWGLNYYTDADYEAAEYVLENGATNTEAYYFTGCHGDGLNWFTDYNGNWVGAY